jgi:hypothetical protein
MVSKMSESDISRSVVGLRILYLNIYTEGTIIVEIKEITGSYNIIVPCNRNAKQTYDTLY